jgi:antitoxin CptB
MVDNFVQGASIMIDTPLYKRLYYQSRHRGTKELDGILGEFAKKALHTFTYEALERYDSLLGIDETMLFTWLSRMASAPPPHDVMVAYIQDTLSI